MSSAAALALSVDTLSTGASASASASTSTGQTARKRFTIVNKDNANPAPSSTTADSDVNTHSNSNKNNNSLYDSVFREGALDSAVFVPKKAPRSSRPKVVSPQRDLNSKRNRSSGDVSFAVIKVFVGFVVIATLSRAAWNLSSKYHGEDIHGDGLVSQDQFAHLQELIKNTTKAIQENLEALDHGLGQRIRNLKTEVQEIMAEQAEVFASELKNIKAETAEMGDELSQLTGSRFLSRDEIVALVDSMFEKKSSNHDGKDGSKSLSLDDVIAAVKSMVDAEMERHWADGMGRVDYAVKTGGGFVVSHSEAYNSHSCSQAIMLKTSSSLHPMANTVLEPSFGEPGRCLPLKGSSSYIVIALRTAIFAEAVTLEHVDKSVAYDRTSSPKEFLVSGWHVNSSKEKPSEVFTLGNFTYDLEESNLQTFHLPDTAEKKLINMIKLEILSNHGNPAFTCVYRFRVHGREHP